MAFERPENLRELTAPVWTGDLVYEESFWPIQPKGANRDAPYEVTLLYRADEILSVTNLDRTVVLEAGRDYTLSQNGTLLIPADSAVRRILWEEYQISDKNDPHAVFTCRDGDYLYFAEGVEAQAQQYFVTYRHSDKWGERFAPKTPFSKLPRTKALLSAGKPLSFCFFGDSITTGCNSTGMPEIHVPPYTPMFPVLTVMALEERFGSEIHYVNHAVGGTVSGWGVERLPLDFAGEQPDIMFIGFGMNDASGHTDANTVVNNIRTMMEQTLKLNPDCEFLICSTTLPNPLANQFVGNHEEHEPLLAALCEEYGDRAALVTMTSVHRALMERKHYFDMTGNNINHPNDFLARIYAQTILSCLLGDVQ